MSRGNLLHIHCRHCGEILKDKTRAYCPPCNLHLAYKAMPILLGILLSGSLDSSTRAPEVEFYDTEPKWPIYEHARYILD